MQILHEKACDEINELTSYDFWILYNLKIQTFLYIYNCIIIVPSRFTITWTQI